MKRQFLLLVMALAMSTFAMAQEATSTPTDSLSVDTTTPTDTIEVAPRYQPKDLYASSESLEGVVAEGVAEGIATNPNQLNNRYKLYPTENTWTFLKLDTCLGYVWQVQYVINSTNRWQELIVYSRLNWDESWEPMDNIGRFELYPTKNTYNFLLLDKKTGRIWQIQWSTESGYTRGVIAEIE